MNDLLSLLSSSFHQLSTEFSPVLIAMSYLLIMAAEIGDKSQLVCMILAARYRAGPVIFGAISAFIFLNSLAVTVGITITELVAPVFISVAVALLFIVFGIQALFYNDQGEEEVDAPVVSTHRLLLTTFVLITVAEFGDKTQLAVVALSSSQPPLSIWIGATLALTTASVLGVWLGRTVLQRIPIKRLHQLSGGLFVILGLVASWQAYSLLVQ